MINKVTLVGRLGRDPELKFTQSGTAVCNFSVATSESWKDKSGVKQEHTEWHRIVAWGRLGEICNEYLKKGSLVYIDGKIKSGEYTDKEGITRKTFDIEAKDVQFLSTRSDSGGARVEGGSDRSRGRQLPPEPDDIPF